MSISSASDTSFSMDAMVALNEAYAILSKAQSRRAYDRTQGFDRTTKVDGSAET
jgi:DnaJ-class molecular chaperone